MMNHRRFMAWTINRRIDGALRRSPRYGSVLDDQMLRGLEQHVPGQLRALSLIAEARHDVPDHEARMEPGELQVVFRIEAPDKVVDQLLRVLQVRLLAD